MSLDRAIRELCPDAQFVMGETYESINWIIEPANKPTKEQLEAKADEIRLADEAQAYKEQRAMNYPSLDQLVVALWESVVEGKTDGIEAVQTIREAVKAEFPK